jgi:hypothetical protein
VEQEIQYRQWRYLFGHIVYYLRASLRLRRKITNFSVKSGKFSEKFCFYFAISVAVAEVENA